MSAMIGTTWVSWLSIACWIRRLDFVARVARLVELAEQPAEFARVGLAQEGVEFGDQRGDGGLLVHRLIGQGAEFAAQRGDHPA